MATGCLCRAPVAAFIDLFNDLATEGTRIVRVTLCDQPLVYNNRTVFPVAASIDNVSFDRTVTGNLSSAQKIGFSKKPGCMADRGNWFSGLEKVSNKSYRLCISAQNIGIDLAAGHYKRVKLLNQCIRDFSVNRDSLTPVGLVPAFDFTIFDG